MGKHHHASVMPTDWVEEYWGDLNCWLSRGKVEEIHSNLTRAYGALRQACISMSRLPKPTGTYPVPHLDLPLTRADAAYWNILQALIVIGDILTTNPTEEEVEE